MYNKRFLDPLSKLMKVLSAAGSSSDSIVGNLTHELLKMTALIVSVQNRARKVFKNISPQGAFNEAY